MKKITALLLAAAMLLSLTACSLTFLNKNVNAGADPKDDRDSGVMQDAGAPAAPEVPSVEPDIPADAPAAPLPDPDKGSGDITDPPAKNDSYTIYISHTDVTLKSAGEKFRLSAWDSKGSEPSVCTFTSDNPEIASVDEAGGEVTAVAPGTANITIHTEFASASKDFKCIVRCSWKAEDGENAQPASGAVTGTNHPSPDSFFSTLQGKYEGLGHMMALDGELLDTYYPGLSSVPNVEALLVEETMISTANMAIGLVVLNDNATADDLAAVTKALQSRINVQADGGAFYPDSCETWKQGVITSVSNCVGMFVYPDEAQSMADLFTATYGN